MPINFANSPDSYTLVGFRNILEDYTRPYMFAIDIPAIGGSGADAVQKLSAFARSAKLPNYTLGDASIAFQGLSINVATVAQFTETFDVTFLSDEKQVIRKRCLGWMNQIYDPARLQPAAPISYKADNVKIMQLDRIGRPVTTYTFYGIYPKSVSGWNVGHDQQQQIATFNVSFKYDFFTIDALDVQGNVSDSTPGILSSVPQFSETGANIDSNAGIQTGSIDING